MKKNKLDDNDDTNDSTDPNDMEKEFHKVVQDLMTDKSLEKFREEYEKLHSELLKSHEKNAILVEKCKALNSEILANANKVNTIMNLSKDDQKTLINLRFEFEKAWKLVEASQEREEKTNEVIEGLKQEINSLARSIDEGKQQQSDLTLQEIQDSVTSLKKETETQSIQIKSLTNEVTKNIQSKAQILENTNSLTLENQQLISELEKEQNKNIEISKETNETYQTLLNLKNENSDLLKTFDDNKQKIKEQKEKLYEIKSILNEDENYQKALIDEKEFNLQNKKTIQIIKEDKAKENDQKLEEINEINDIINQKKKEKENFQQKLKEENENIKKQKQDLINEKKLHEKIINEKSQKRNELSTKQNEIHILKSNKHSKELQNSSLKREIDLNRYENNKISTKKVEETKETKTTELQSLVVTNEIAKFEKKEIDDKNLINKINTEIENYQTNTVNIISNHKQIIEEVKIKEQQIDELNLNLTNLKSQINHQNVILETMQNNRDICKRQLETTISENNKLNEYNIQLENNIKSLKNTILEKDKMYKEERMNRKKINKLITKTVKNKKEIEIKTKEFDDQTTEQRNKIQRNLYLIKQAEIDLVKQKQIKKDLEFIHTNLNIEISKKMKEISVVKSKIDTLNGLILIGASKYKKQIEVIQNLKEKIEYELNERNKLQNHSKHFKELCFEKVRIQKSILMEQCKGKAIQEEMDRPMNVHPWRLLEGSDPELYRLIQTSIKLRDRIMTQINSIQRLKILEERLKLKNDSLSKHVLKGYNNDIKEEYKYWNKILQHKISQLHSYENKLNERKGTVNDQKEQIDLMRSLILDEKSEYNEAKKKVDNIRASTSAINNTKNILKDLHYVGGGFALNLPRQTPPPLLSAKSMRAPKIILPKSASLVQKKIIPLGWNPKRAPIKPFLPTVSQG